jgi:hypothetical protein
MGYPFNIESYPDLPLKVRTWLQKEWARQESGARGPGRPPKYPWDSWMDGKVHPALAGRDFHMSAEKFRDLLRQKAYHAGLHVWTQIDQVYEKGPTGPVQFWINFQFEPRKTPAKPLTPEDRRAKSDGLGNLTVEELKATDPRFRTEGQ